MPEAHVCQDAHETPKRKVGLVLTGGGAKGAYQIGVWKALLEKGIKIEAVSGSSIGALNAILIVSDDWAKANQLWLGLSTHRLISLSPFFLLALILNFIHAVLSPLTSSTTYSDSPRIPSVLDRRRSLVLSLVGTVAILILALVLGRPEGGWIVILLPLLLVAGPVIPGAIADFLNLSITSRRPLQELLDDAVDWSEIANSQVPIYVTIARWASSYSHRRIARLATVPENAREAELYGPDFVKLIRRTRWRAKDATELAPYYLVLNDQTVDEAKALVLASMAFPAGVFPRVKIGTSRYMDGGAYDNTPLYPLVFQCENIFVVHLRPVPRKHTQERLLARFRFRVWQINRLMNRIGEPGYRDEVVYGPFPRLIHIAPKKALGFSLLGTLLFSKTRSEKLIEQGYKDAIEVLTKEGADLL